MARETLRTGRWVIVDEKELAIIARAGHPASVVHYVNSDGTTKMRLDERLGRYTTHEDMVSNERLTISPLDRIPASRRPKSK